MDMKKTLLTAIICLASIALLSLETRTNKDEVTITISAVRQSSFDMFRDGNTVKGLRTPYEMKLGSEDSKFIFKSNTSGMSLRIEVKKEGASLTATWPITVVLIEGGRMTTFGMD